MDLSSELININHALAGSGINLRIEQRGRWLNLRGPLPCRKGTGPIKSQRISLQIEAEQQGLKEAERVLQLVNYQLQRGQFDWSQWTTKPELAQPRGIASGVKEALASFEATFFAEPHRRRSPAGSRTTWTSAYLPYLRRLACLANNKQQGFDASMLSETLASYADGSRSRQQCATALSALARHIELALPDDWRAEAGGYGLHRARFRQLPSDNQIIETVLHIPNPRWRLAYGLMATYGLRNHEVFFCDLSALAKGSDQVLRVLPNTKTGEHQVWPFHPNWVEHFELEQLGSNAQALPKVNVDLNHTTLQQVGRRVSEQFRRYELPLTPYNLRHAWAVRTIHIGLPDTVAARMMGHSVAIHTRTYHHWITRRDQQQAVDTALARKLS